MAKRDDALHKAFGVALITLESLLIERGVLIEGWLSASLAGAAEAQAPDVAADLNSWATMLAQVEAGAAPQQ